MKFNGSLRPNPYLHNLPPPAQKDELPFIIKHSVCATLQKLIEEVLFYWANRDVKYFLERTAWTAPEAGELSDWLNALRSKLHPPHRADILDLETTVLLERVRHLRHCAVHRHDVPLDGAERMCQDAIKLAVRFQDDLRAKKMCSIHHALLSQDAEAIERVLQEPLINFLALLTHRETSSRKPSLVRPLRHAQLNTPQITRQNSLQHARYPLRSNGQTAFVRRRSISPVRQQGLGSVVMSGRGPDSNMRQRKREARKANALPLGSFIDLTGDSDDETPTEAGRGRTLSNAIDLTMSPGKPEVQSNTKKLKPPIEKINQSLLGRQIMGARDGKDKNTNSLQEMPDTKDREQIPGVSQANTHVFWNEPLFGNQSINASNTTGLMNTRAGKDTIAAPRFAAPNSQAAAVGFQYEPTPQRGMGVAQVPKVVPRAVHANEFVLGISSTQKPKGSEVVQLKNNDENKRIMDTPKAVLQAVGPKSGTFGVPSVQTAKAPESRFMNYGARGSNLPSTPQPATQSRPSAVIQSYNKNYRRAYFPVDADFVSL
ncbi:hypothetical protein BJ875DRAFT_464920 [Amylocarpus encephaloides]|uniref:Uncharacterized protein n=1 Tax=Amylocarpus encephaloides TaxID=45428 RepID=A0A9P7YGM6_9HELO|nr:hypothetical protein BJ875DRAFT_464920 [Amylocarpus encephaloides]